MRLCALQLHSYGRKLKWKWKYGDWKKRHICEPSQRSLFGAAFGAVDGVTEDGGAVEGAVSSAENGENPDWVSIHLKGK